MANWRASFEAELSGNMADVELGLQPAYGAKRSSFSFCAERGKEVVGAALAEAPGEGREGVNGAATIGDLDDPLLQQVQDAALSLGAAPPVIRQVSRTWRRVHDQAMRHLAIGSRQLAMRAAARRCACHPGASCRRCLRAIRPGGARQPGAAGKKGVKEGGGAAGRSDADEAGQRAAALSVLHSWRNISSVELRTVALTAADVAVVAQAFPKVTALTRAAIPPITVEVREMAASEGLSWPLLDGVTALSALTALRALTLHGATAELAALTALTALECLQLYDLCPLQSAEVTEAPPSFWAGGRRGARQLADVAAAAATAAAAAAAGGADGAGDRRGAVVIPVPVYPRLTHLEVHGLGASTVSILPWISAGAAPPPLTHLSMDFTMGGLGALPALTGLTELRVVMRDLVEAGSGAHVSELSSLSHLRALELPQWLEGWEELLEKLTELTRLTLGGERGVRLPGVRGLECMADLYELQELDLALAAFQTELTPLACLMSLRRLVLRPSSSQPLGDLSPLTGLHELNSLAVRARDRVAVDSDSLAKLTGLSRLELHACEVDLSVLSLLTKLTHLDVVNKSFPQMAVTDLSGLSRLRGLHFLRLCHVMVEVGQVRPQVGLAMIRVLGSMPHLTHLHLGTLACHPADRAVAPPELQFYHHAGLNTVNSVAGCVGLQALDLSNWLDLECLEGLRLLTQLTRLDLSGCRAISELDPLSGLTELRELRISMASALTSLSSLAVLTGMRSLSVTHCNRLLDIGAVEHMRLLTQLQLSACGHLQDLTPLSSLTGLQELCLKGCARVVGVGALRGVIRLHTLNMTACGGPDVFGIRVLSRLAALRAALVKRHISALELVTMRFTLILLPMLSFATPFMLFRAPASPIGWVMLVVVLAMTAVLVHGQFNGLGQTLLLSPATGNTRGQRNRRPRANGARGALGPGAGQQEDHNGRRGWRDWQTQVRAALPLSLMPPSRARGAG